MEVERVTFYVLKLPVILEVHPGCMTLGDVNGLLRHVFEIQDARLDHLLRLLLLLRRHVRHSGVISIDLRCDHRERCIVFHRWPLSRGCLRQSLVRLEHLLEHQEKRQDLVLARARNQDLSLCLEDSLLDFGLQPFVAHKLVVLSGGRSQRGLVAKVVAVE